MPGDIAGNWYVFVVADGDNQIFEFGNENNNANYDREQPGSPMLIRATPPDLIIPNTLNAPASGQAAGQITVGWTVRNQGAFDAAPSWFDTIYLSSDNTLDPATDTPLATVSRANPLGAGLTYDASANVTLPSCISGNYYLFVFTDSRRQIFEYDPTINAEANNTSAARQISITNSPADLRVTTVSNPGTANAGQPVSVSWTVANQGTGATPGNVWNDSVYLSSSPTFVQANSLRIGTFTHNGALAVSESYSRTENIIVPNTAQGNYYVFVVTDANANIEECTNNNNNSGGSATVLNVTNNLPDLTVSNFAFVNNFIAGQNVNVTWTVANSGTAAAQNSSWGDSVYFSTNNVLDGSDRRLADVVVSGGLAQNATYTKDAQVTLPIVAPGSYFLIVNTDNGNNVFEGQSENNNIRPLILPVDVPPVDLQVTMVTAPATVFSGQTTTVNWTIQNTGSNVTVGANWTDAVVLSLDQIDDPTDRVIGYLQHEGALNGGASYNATTDVFVPSGLAGSYYVFVRADRNNQLAESNENNNSSSPRPIALQLAPPADLIVSNVTQPATASPGETATFNWTVQNIGTNPATGLWTDTVYLSSDQTWDIGDILVGRYTAGVSVAPGQSYNGTLNTTLPAVNLGNYYVIVRTDIRNRVIETNESNNTGASGGTTTVDVPTLQLGVPQSTTLVTGQERFYKFNAPANETVRVSLDGQDGSSNELYTRFGQMASRNAYDFLFDRLYEPDQQLLIPNTNAGNYYNMIRGENVPNSIAIGDGKKIENQTKAQFKIQQPSSAENVAVKAEIVPFSITSISPQKGGNNGQITLRIEGAKFDYFTTLELIKNETIIQPTRLQLVNENQIFATFNPANAPIGRYNVHIHSEKTVLDVNEADGSVYARQIVLGDQILTDSFEISSNNNALNASLVLPASARKDRVFSFLLYVSNDGNSDIPAPIYRIVSPSQTAMSVDSTLANSSIEKTVVVIGKANPTFLSPGEKATIQFYAKATRFPSSDFTLQNLNNNSELINWDILESYYRETSDNSEWAQTWANFKNIVGTTRESFNTALRILAAEKSLNSDKTFFFADELISDLLIRAKYGQSNSNLTKINLLSKTNNEKYKKYFKEVDLNSKNTIRKALPVSTPNPAAFCTPLSSSEQAIAVDQSMRVFPLALPAIYNFFGTQDGQLWTLYLNYGNYNTGSPRSGRVERSFQDGSEIVEGTFFADGFRNSRTTISKDMKILEAVKEALKRKAGDIPSGREYSISLNELIPDEIKEEKLRIDLNYGYPFDIPGNLAGGGDPQQLPPDRRIVSGLVTVMKSKNKCDKDVLEVQTRLTYQTGDTVDFCPGQTGNGLEQYLTIPLSRLEASNEAYDVGINVVFQKELEPFTLTTDNNNSSSNECRKPPPPNCCGGGGGSVETQLPSDPNEKIAPLGYGQQKYLGILQEMPYTINFENVPTATASAQRVRVTDQLDPNVDPRTFRLKEIGFGSYRLQVPENRAFFGQRVQLGAEFNNILADISAGVDITTGRVTWTLTAIDPATGEQPNSANLGLLPPNDETGRGQGFVTYTVQPKQNAPTGTIIRNNATIIFDTEEPITTNTVTNTLDADIPTSAVNALPPTQSNTTFTVSWAGQDAANGSGLQNYDVWVAENDGAYQPFVSGTTDTSAEFTGTAGKTYKFYSIARDNAGNVEAAPNIPDATTTIANQCPVTLNPTSANVAATSGTGSFTVIVNTTCAWTVASNDSWISVTSGSSGNGNGTVNYSVLANTGAQRTGTLTVNEQTFTINQAAQPPVFSIGGVVNYGTTPVGQPAKYIAGALISATGTNSASATTDSSGIYSITGLAAGNYTVTPTKTGDVNSISSFDASLVARRAVNLITLTPNQMIAADVSNNGSVSSFDAALIAQTIVGIPNPGIAGQWKFVPALRNYPSITANQTGQNYQAILMGDVSGDWIPPVAPPTASVNGTSADKQKEGHFNILDPNLILNQSNKQSTVIAADVLQAASINVWLSAKSTISTGTTVVLPVVVGDTTGAGIYSYDFTVSFDPKVIQPAASAFDASGTLSGTARFTITPRAGAGQMTISGFGSEPLSGAGTLIFLRFNVIRTAGSATPDSTNLKFNSFVFNEGNPAAITNSRNLP